MLLSNNSAYAVFAVVHVATHARQVGVAADDLVALCGLPAQAVAALLARLVAAGILRRAADLPDGYALEKPPEKITLLEIVEAIDGKQDDGLALPTDFGRPDEQAPDATARGGAPSTQEKQPALKTVRSIAAALLAGHTIADLVEAADDDAR